jgi:hypothetical protein
MFGSGRDGTRTDKTYLLLPALGVAGVDPRHATMIGDRGHDMIGCAKQCHDRDWRARRLQQQERAKGLETK